MASSLSSDHVETKIRIPFPSASDPQLYIVGILAQKSSQIIQPSSSKGNPRPLALILHGVLAHKDQAYHKALAKLLPIDSFRFDFRANGESSEGSEWHMSNFEEDWKDLDRVWEYLREEYGYVLDLVVGHSRGSLGGWGWFATRFGSEASSSSSSSSSSSAAAAAGRVSLDQLPLWVSSGGRWRMNRIHDRDHLYNPAFEKQGYYLWKAKVAGQAVEVKVTPEQVEAFERYPIAEHVSHFPAEADCLLLHGTSDETVPCADVAFYLNTLYSRSDRHPSQTQVHLVEGGNHMFKGCYDEVAEVITRWYETRRCQRRGGKTGGGGRHRPEQMALEAKQEEDVLERSWKETGVPTSSSSQKGKL